MYSIRQTAAGWEVLDGDGALVGVPHPDYDSALAALAGLLGELAELAADDPEFQAAAAAGSPPPGALPRRWRSGQFGEALQAETGPYRDFSGCEFTYRSGGAPLPLMLMDSDGHGGFDTGVSRLAGWSDSDTIVDGVPTSAGWLHDNDAGREFARILDAQGRYGVSLDPGENVVAEFQCTEYDDDGFCIAETVHFTEYEIAGRTGVPFPGFAQAYVEWESPVAAAEGSESPEAAGLAASAGLRDPAPEYLTMEPPPLDDPRWVAQRATGLPAIPLHISDPDADGYRHVYGMWAAAGVCHIGIRDECITFPPSPSDYANFHLHVQRTADGVDHLVGNLVYGRDHAPLAGLNIIQARDNYANTGLRWANVRAMDVYAPEGAMWNGEPIGGTLLGGWVTGVVLPHVPATAVAVLRAGGLSGDWREEQVNNMLGSLDLVGCQSVNVPGFPITRQAALAAGGVELPNAGLAYLRRGGRIVAAQGIGLVERDDADMGALVAAGTVRCATCAEPTGPSGARPDRQRQSAVARAARDRAQANDARLDRMEAKLDRALANIAALEGRTRHLRNAEAAARREALRASSE